MIQFLTVKPMHQTSDMNEISLNHAFHEPTKKLELSILIIPYINSQANSLRKLFSLLQNMRLPEFSTSEERKPCCHKPAIAFLSPWKLKRLRA